MEEEWYDNYENDSRFMKIYENIVNKYGSNLDEIREIRRKKYIRLIICTIAVVTIIYVGAMAFVYFNVPGTKVSLSFLPIYLVFVGLLILSFYMNDISGTFVNIREDELYNYFNEKIVKEIIKGISADFDKDDKIEDWLYDEFHENFDPYRRRDFYVFANHFYGKKDGIQIEMFNILEDMQYKKHPAGFGYIYSSSEIKGTVSDVLSFSSNKKKELLDLDPRLKKVVEEFSKYSTKYRVKICGNRLMIAIDTDYIFSPGSVRQTLDPYYLYCQYMILDFAIRLTIRLNQVYI